MANKLLGMHKIRQLLLFLERGLSQRSIEKELHISRKTIGVYHQRFRDTGLEFNALLKLQDEQLEQILGLIRSVESQEVDPRTAHFHNLVEYFNKELSRTGVTRLLLWQEYIHDYPSGFQYDVVEIYYEHQRIAVHPRSYKSHGITSVLEHMPEKHQAIIRQRGWNPEYYVKRATQAGPYTVAFFEKVMNSKMMIDQSYNACRGLIRLMETYGSVRMEAACKRGLQGRRFTYTAIKKVLENNMDQLEQILTSESRLPMHTNLRGPQAYE